MKEKVNGFLGSVREQWGKASKTGRIVFVSVASVVVIVLIVAAAMMNQKNYVMLSNGMSTQETAKVMAVLGEMGVTPEISNTGAIYVPEDDASKVRMQLAMQGVSSASFNYDIYQDGAGLTSTQYDKNRSMVFQLQNRLQATIEVLDEVSLAVVTLSVPEKNVYALQTDQNEPTASVMIKTEPGASLTAEQVQGILNVVRDSVSGLKEENISIMDETGDLKLQLAVSQGTGLNKLSLTDQVNGNLGEKILDMLEPVFGRGNVRVGVNAVLDTDSRIRESEQYVPMDEDNPTNNPLDSAVYDREKVGGYAGPAGGVAGATDNVDVPQYSANEVDTDDADSFAAHDSLKYLVGSVREQVTKEGFEITDLTVAVLINAPGLSDAQRDAVYDIVSMASGATAQNISVQGIQFQGSTGYVDPETVQATQPMLDTTSIVILAVLILAATMLLIMTIVYFVQRNKKAKLAAAEAAALAEQEAALLMDVGGEDDGLEPITFGDSNEQKLKNQIRDLADSDPEIVANLLKTWLVQN